MVKTFVEYLKQSLGAGFSMCSLDEYKLNALSAEWAKAHKPVYRSVDTVTTRNPFAVEGLTMKMEPMAVVLSNEDGPGYKMNIKPQSVDLQIEHAKLSLSLYITLLAEEKALELDKRDHFKESRDSWNKTLEDFDNIELPRYSCWKSYNAMTPYEKILELFRGFQSFVAGLWINENDDIWASAHNPVKILGDIQREERWEVINDRKEKYSNSIYRLMNNSELKQYEEHWHQMDVIELRAQKRQKNNS